jgi:hypothetical protein
MRNGRIMLAFSIVFIMLFSTISAEGKDTQLFGNIIELTQGNIEEIAIKVTFHTYGKGKDELEKVLNELNIKDVDSVESSTDHGNYSINFSGEKVSGSIVNIIDGASSSIVLNIIEKSTYNNVEEIKNSIVNSLKLSSNNIQYSYNIKAKIPSNDMRSVNDNIINFLKGKGSSNLESIDINNGYSTVAYTKSFEPINSNGKFIDLNYAVVTYNTGTYIIIGTPIIMIPY